MFQQDDERTGWEDFKEVVVDLASDDCVEFGPVVSCEEPRELPQLLDQLVAKCRSSLNAFRRLPLAETKNEGFHSSRAYFDLIEPVRRELYPLFYRAFHCVREAEAWTYRQFGPGNDTRYLDKLGDSLSAVFYTRDIVRSCG